jgi:hypothetical protein
MIKVSCHYGTGLSYLFSRCYSRYHIIVMMQAQAQRSTALLLVEMAGT